MCDFQMILDERERPSCVKEVDISSSLPFMRIGGTSELHLREVTTCVVFLWLNETRLSSVHFSIIFKSLARREAEMLLWNGISP